MNVHHAQELQRLKTDFAAHKDAVRARLAEFALVKPEEYFYELVYCLLTPQSSAVNAGWVVAILRDADAREEELPLADTLRNKLHYIRFHNTKARRIHEARAGMSQVTEKVLHTSDSAELRSWLVSNVNGLGWKEASHFLRNIGRRDLAILDRHILRNLVRCGVLRSMPKTLTAKRYLSIERRFAKFAVMTGIAMDELDLLFWSRETGQILK